MGNAIGVHEISNYSGCAHHCPSPGIFPSRKYSAQGMMKRTSMRAATPNVPPTTSNISMIDAGSSRGKEGLPVSFATPILEMAGVGLIVGDGREVGAGIGVGEGPRRSICVCACNAPVVLVTTTVTVV